jgi:AraC-like DNA-binding protein
MSKTRHAAQLDRLADSSSWIVTLTHDYPGGHVIPPHFHDRDQLVYATRGVMTVRTESGAWVVPPHRAVWIPTAVPHTIATSGTVAMRTLYLRRRLAPSLPRDCCVVNVTPLLKELILHACASGSLRAGVAWQRHVIDVILDQFTALQMVPLQLPTPTDSRALRVAGTLLANPAARRLEQICAASGASRRTVERLFQRETGMTFGKWRQQLRLMHAMRLLGEGAKVTSAALDAGYSTASSFVAAFRRALGTTPTQYFRTPPRD